MKRLPIDRIAIEFERGVPLWEAAVPPEPRPWTVILPHGVDGWPEHADVVTYAGEHEAERIRIGTQHENRLTLVGAGVWVGECPEPGDADEALAVLRSMFRLSDAATWDDIVLHAASLGGGVAGRARTFRVQLAEALDINTNDRPDGVPRWADLLNVVRSLADGGTT